MLVHKCDKCRKKLPKDEKNLVGIRAGWKSYEFCVKCGAPIARILKRYKLTESK